MTEKNLMNFRPLVLFMAALASFTPSMAQASCVSASRCLCTGAHAAADVRVTGIAEARSTVQVDAIEGVESPYLVGETFTLPRQAEDVVGRRLLVFFNQENVSLIASLDEEGHFTCDAAEPDLVLPAREAMQTGVRSDCHFALEEKGLQEPPCRDAGPFSGCAGAPGGAAILVSALLLFLRRAGVASRRGAPDGCRERRR